MQNIQKARLRSGQYPDIYKKTYKNVWLMTNASVFKAEM